MKARTRPMVKQNCPSCTVSNGFGISLTQKLTTWADTCYISELSPQGQYLCTADLLFDWFGFDQIGKFGKPVPDRRK